MSAASGVSPAGAATRSNGGYHRRDSCRSCGGTDLASVISLGPSPLANAFLKSPEEFAAERSYPLDVVRCPACSLLQLADVIDPETLFRHYLYVTGTSDTMARHNAEHAASMVALLGLTPGDLVVEIASNDGSLLRCFQAHGVRVLGVEPAENVAGIARASGVPTVNEFFDDAVAGTILDEHGPVRLVIANNVLAHVDEPASFLRASARLTGEGGLVVVEVPYLGDLLDRLEYDTIYHEHLCYFSVSTLRDLCRAAGLSVVRVDRLPVHGGSLRLYASPRPGGDAPEVVALAGSERAAGLTTPGRYEEFARGVHENRRLLRGLLEDLAAEGRTLAAYGAPAKGNTLLNACGIDTRLIPFTVDRSPLKTGLFTPGAHIPVRPVPALLQEQPDYALLLAWNFAGEIHEQQAEYRRRGGRFILPIPSPVVL